MTPITLLSDARSLAGCRSTLRLPGLAIVLALIALLLPPLAAAKPRKLNPGLYAQHYQMNVSTSADWLQHPTGRYVDLTERSNRKRHWYDPSYRETSDIDAAAADLSAQGYVMVGYSAFNTSDAAPSIYDDPNFQSLTPGEQNGRLIGLKISGRFQQATNPVGDVVDAARWANASIVVMQRDFAFQSAATAAHRIVAADERQQVRNFGSASNVQTERLGRERFTATSHNSYDDTVQQQGRQWSTVLTERNENHYDVVATFWKKADVRKLTLGVTTDAVPNALRRVVGTRHGRLITAVVGGTPAWDADLWEGDVLLGVGGERVTTAEVFNDLIDRHRGRETTLTIWREGELYDLAVRLNG